MRKIPLFPRSCVSQTGPPGWQNRQEPVRKNVLFLGILYSFREMRCYFLYLLRVPQLMGGNHFKPLINIQHPQKGMLPAVSAQIPLLGFFQERQRALACSSQLRQHLFLVSQEGTVQRHRRLPPDQPRFHKPERQVKPFSEGNLFWSFLSHAIGSAHHGALHHNQMGHEFRGGPLRSSWFAAPLFWGNRVGSAKKASLRPCKSLHDWLDRRHSHSQSSNL